MYVSSARPQGSHKCVYTNVKGWGTQVHISDSTFVKNAKSTLSRKYAHHSNIICAYGPQCVTTIFGQKLLILHSKGAGAKAPSLSIPALDMERTWNLVCMFCMHPQQQLYYRASLSCNKSTDNSSNIIRTTKSYKLRILAIKSGSKIFPWQVVDLER